MAQSEAVVRREVCHLVSCRQEELPCILGTRGQAAQMVPQLAQILAALNVRHNPIKPHPRQPVSRRLLDRRELGHVRIGSRML